MSSVFIQNFGCRVNQAEAFDWADELRKRGVLLDDDPGKSPIVIVNSCTLTARADRDVRKFIRKIGRDHPRARIIVTGCLAERDPEGLKKLPGVWQVVPNPEKAAIAKNCPAGPESAARIKATDLHEAPGSYRVRALVKIQDGCDMTCSFCVIPSVRGRSVSRPAEEIFARVEELVSEGYREIVLAGIHLCSYGRDLDPRSSLFALLETVHLLPGDFKIRLSSLDPRLLPDALLDLVTGSARFAPHFHLSLQHGSDRILKAMGRDSTAAAYRTLIGKINRRAPEANIGADFIVGYPGETSADFEATAALLSEAPLGYAHVFSYSARPGTKAAEARPVDPATVKKRAGILRQLSEEKSLAYRRRFIDRILEGIVIQRKPGGLEVLTSNYLEVLVPDTGAPEGSSVRVRIEAVSDELTAGEICDNE